MTKREVREAAQRLRNLFRERISAERHQGDEDIKSRCIAELDRLIDNRLKGLGA